MQCRLLRCLDLVSPDPNFTISTIQVYSVRDSPLCLTGTAEVPLAAVAMDSVLAEAELPLRLAAFGHCFRTEAGAAGMACHAVT